MNMQQVFHHIVLECRNGCTDAASTWIWIKRFHPELMDNLDASPGLQGALLRAFLQTLNFHAIRENQADLLTFLKG
jgi:hypothetical protein